MDSAIPHSGASEGLLDAETAAPLARSELSNLDPSSVPYRLHVRGARDMGIPFKPISLSAISNTHKFAQYCSNRRLKVVDKSSIKDSADIPLVDCDKNATLLKTDIYELQTYNVSCVVFYSNSEAGCSLVEGADWFKKAIPNSFTTITNGDTLQLLARVTGQDTIASITKKSAIGGIEIFAIVIVVVAILFAALAAGYRYMRKRPRLTKAALNKLPLVKVCSTPEQAVAHDPEKNLGAMGDGRSARQNDGACPPFPQPPGEALLRANAPAAGEHRLSAWHHISALHRTPGSTPWRINETALARDAYPFPIVAPHRQEAGGTLAETIDAAEGPSTAQPEPLGLAAPAEVAGGRRAPQHQSSDPCWADEPPRRHHWSIRKSLTGMGALLSPGQLLSPGALLAKRHIGSYVNDHDEVCAICLEAYKTGELLRKLPCNHYFHSSCVDRWLLKSSTACPLCRSNVLSQTHLSRAAAAVAAATRAETTEERRSFGHSST